MVPLELRVVVRNLPGLLFPFPFLYSVRNGLAGTAALPHATERPIPTPVSPS